MRHVLGIDLGVAIPRHNLDGPLRRILGALGETVQPHHVAYTPPDLLRWSILIILQIAVSYNVCGRTRIPAALVRNAPPSNEPLSANSHGPARAVTLLGYQAGPGPSVQRLKCLQAPSKRGVTLSETQSLHRRHRHAPYRLRRTHPAAAQFPLPRPAASGLAVCSSTCACCPHSLAIE